MWALRHCGLGLDKWNGLGPWVEQLGQAQLSSKPKVNVLGPSSCLATCFCGFGPLNKNYQS